MRTSLLWRLITGCTLTVVVVLALLGSGLYLVVRRSLEQQFDRVLVARVQSVAANLDWNGDQLLSVDSTALVSSKTAERFGLDFVQIWNRDGKTVFKSDALQTASLSWRPCKTGGVAFYGITLQHHRHFREALVATDGPGRDERALTAPDKPAPPKAKPQHAAASPGQEAVATPSIRRAVPSSGLIIGVAEPTGPLDDTLAAVAVDIALSCLAAAAISAVLVGLVVKAGLSPMAALATMIGGVGERDLAERLSLRDSPRELTTIVSRLNGLLDRLEKAFLRERTMTANIAHELRTPLAGLRATLELATLHPRRSDEYVQTLNDGLTIADQMQTLISNLLTLARVESGELHFTQETIALLPLLREALAQRQMDIQRRKLQVDVDGVSTLAVPADRPLLTLVFRNIVDNAVSYTNAGGRVWVRCQNSPQGILLTVGNSGSQVRTADVAHVFERFWRGDVARSASGGHCGLGLALVGQILSTMGAMVSAESQYDGDFVLIIRFGKTP